MSQDKVLEALSEGGALHALSAYKQFIIYKLVPNPKKPGKMNKLPCDVTTGRMFPNDYQWQRKPECQVDYFTAYLSAVSFGPEYGVAFLFTPDDPFCFVDIDECILPDRSYTEVVSPIYSHFQGCALEISQSGTGLHLFGTYTDMPAHGCRKPGIEFYHEWRFVALTGDIIAGDAATSAQTYLQSFINTYLPPGGDGPGLVTDWTTEPRADWRGIEDDEELIRRMCSRKRGIAQAGFAGSAVKALPVDLWENNEDVLIAAYPPDGSDGDAYNRSSADMALAQHLAFWTGCNCERMERLMRQSALYRAKWDDHGTYLCEFTIMKAVRQQVDVFQEKEAVRPVEWTEQPVDVFPDSSAPLDMLASLMAKPDSAFAKSWNDGADPQHLLNTLAWRTGGNCEAVRQILEIRKDIEFTPELRVAVMEACARQETFYGVDEHTAQKLVAIDLDRVDYARAEAVLTGYLPQMQNVFRRDGQLVWVNSAGSIVTYGLPRLASKLETYVNFTKGKKTSGVSAPDALVNRVLSKQDYPELGEIRAAVQYPTARVDGTVITEPGLDHSTGLYLLRQSDHVPRLLGVAGLTAALGRVWAPFAEFPFDSPASAGAMLAALLTGVCRVSVDTAPAFLVNAQAPGTGKSKLCECIMLVAGESKTAVNFPSEPSEQEKTLTAMLLRAPRGMFFDNLKGYLKDTSSFCMAMTSAQYRARMLGGLSTVEISNRALWVLNGNNVVITGDAVRRVLTVGLESPENPGDRQYAFDPVEVIERDPELYRRDLLDILYTYGQAGQPRGSMTGYASFEVWNRLVRGCVLWLSAQGVTPRTMGDPMESIRLAREDDPDTMKRELFTAAWLERYGDAEVFIGDVSASDANNPLWSEAYAAVCEHKGRIDHSNLPYYLRTIKGRKTKGLMFKTGAKTKRGVPWRLITAA
jgi:hypothetical protein